MKTVEVLLYVFIAIVIFFLFYLAIRSQSSFSAEVTNPKNGDLLVYQNGRWVNEKLPNVQFDPDITNAQNGDILVYLNGEWVNAPPSFNPDITSPQTNDVLSYQNGEWVNIQPSNPNFNPDISNPQPNDILIYQNGEWVNSELPEPSFNPDISNPQPNDILIYQNGEWVNSEPSFNPDITSPQTNDILSYQNGEWVNIQSTQNFNPDITNVEDGDVLTYINGEWINSYFTLPPTFTIDYWTFTAANLESPYNWNGSSDMNIELQFYSDSALTQLVLDTGIINGNSWTGPGTTTPLQHNTQYYYVGRARSHIVTNSWSQYSTAESWTSPVLDSIRAQLTTSAAAYNAAAVGAWVPITETEYNSIQLNLNDIAVGANPNISKNNIVNFGSTYTYFNSAGLSPVNMGSYITAFSGMIRTDHTASGGYNFVFQPATQSPGNITAVKPYATYLPYTVDFSTALSDFVYYCRKTPPYVDVTQINGVSATESNVLVNSGTGTYIPWTTSGTSNSNVSWTTSTNAGYSGAPVLDLTEDISQTYGNATFQVLATLTPQWPTLPDIITTSLSSTNLTAYEAATVGSFIYVSQNEYDAIQTKLGTAASTSGVLVPGGIVLRPSNYIYSQNVLMSENDSILVGFRYVSSGVSNGLAVIYSAPNLNGIDAGNLGLMIQPPSPTPNLGDICYAILKSPQFLFNYGGNRNFFTTYIPDSRPPPFTTNNTSSTVTTALTTTNGIPSPIPTNSELVPPSPSNTFIITLTNSVSNLNTAIPNFVPDNIEFLSSTTKMWN